MILAAPDVAGDLAIPVHLTVHVLAFTVTAALAAYGVSRRRDAAPDWFWFAAGGLLLAANHVVRGAVLAPDAIWPVYLRAAGYAALAFGGARWVATLPPDRQASSALLPPALVAGTVTMLADVLAQPALPAAAPPMPSLTAGVAGIAAAVASLRGVVGRGRWLLAVGLGLWAAGDLVADGLTVAVISLAGSASVGGWLLWRSRERLLSRVVASFLAALLVLVIGLAALGGILAGSDLQEDELAGLSSAAEARAVEVGQRWTLESLTTAQLFARETLAGLLISGDTTRLERLARDIAELPATDVALLLDADGRVLASFSWVVEATGPLPPSEALTIAGDDVVSGAIGGTAASGLIPVGESDVIAVGAAPVFPRDDGEPLRDQQAGVLVAGRRLAHPSVVEGVARTAGADATVVVSNRVAGTTLPEPVARRVPEALESLEGSARTAALGSRTVFLAAAPLEDGTGTAGWLVLTEDAATIAAAERDFTRGLFLAAVAGVLMAGGLATWAAGRTTRPVRRLTAVADRVAAGDREVRTGIDQPDEVGRLARAFDAMTGALASRERALQEASAVEASLRTRLDVLTASMGEGLVATDASGRIQTLNPAAEQLLDTTMAEAAGRPIVDVLRGPDGTRLLEELGGAGDEDVRATSGLVGDGGRPVSVAATAAPLRGPDGSAQGRVYVLRDTSGEAEVERLKAQILANVSHELRTPLTPIKGYAEVLKSRDLSPDRAAEFASNIVMSTARLERVIGMLVDFASLEADRLDVRPEPTPVDDVVDEVLGAWRERMPERRFSRRLARDLPPVLVDPELLARMLEELMDNAVKFSEGPVRLRASREDGRVRLTVRDEGVGIAEDQLELITRDFHQADASSTRSYGGLGLGLSLVERIAGSFDAEVVIESEPGRGTRVHLLLPVAETGTGGP